MKMFGLQMEYARYSKALRMFNIMSEKEYWNIAKAIWASREKAV